MEIKTYKISFTCKRGFLQVIIVVLAYRIKTKF